MHSDVEPRRTKPVRSMMGSSTQLQSPHSTQLSRSRDLLKYPGEDAPGVGTQRRMPPPMDTTMIQSAPLFPQRSTEECYRAFAAQVKSSCPVVPLPSATVSDASFHADAGPTTGQRSRPSVAADQLQAFPPLVGGDQLEYNRRIVAGRHGGC